MWHTEGPSLRESQTGGTGTTAQSKSYTDEVVTTETSMQQDASHGLLQGFVHGDFHVLGLQVLFRVGLHARKDLSHHDHELTRRRELGQIAAVVLHIHLWTCDAISGQNLANMA